MSLDQFTLDFNSEKYLSLRVTKNSMLKIGTEIDASQIQPYAGFVKIVNRGPILLQPYKNWIVAKVMVRNMGGRNHRDKFKLGEGQPFGRIYLKRFEEMPIFERDSTYLEQEIKKEIKTEPYC